MCVPEIRPLHVLLLGVEEHFPCQAADLVKRADSRGAGETRVGDREGLRKKERWRLKKC